MKVGKFLACAVAVTTLAACNKTSPGSGSVEKTPQVTVTQAAPPPGGSWTDVVNTTPGGYLMGNPNAKVKLVEIGSLSCPHCKHFEDEGAPTLMDRYVKAGTVSWEFRPYIIHGALDMAANLIVRCNGAKTFFPIVQAMYKDQDALMAKIQAVPQDKMNAIQNLPPNQVFVSMANLAGLQDWAAARGVPQAKSNQCLSDQKMIEAEVQRTSDVTNEHPDFPGTPAFILNGTLLKDTASWEKLQPQLDAALK